VFCTLPKTVVFGTRTEISRELPIVLRGGLTVANFDLHAQQGLHAIAELRGLMQEDRLHMAEFHVWRMTTARIRNA
jgi:hypothetical protein